MITLIRGTQILPQIRELVWQGRQNEAEKLALERFMSVPLRQEKYQPFGDIYIHFPNHETVTDYQRNWIFQMQSAGHPTCLEYTFYQEYIASYPDNVMAVSLNSERKTVSPLMYLSPHLMRIFQL
jgi:alpha-L-fucosidase 2